MQSYKGRFEPTRFEDLTVTVDFHCHSACQFCIVQEGMNLFRGVPFETFKKAVDDNGHAPRYRRVTFTGGEITLEKKLFTYLDYARAHGGFDHIRLQTNGRLLADMAYAKRLVAAGVDEFFVSLHGHDAATQDEIAQREGSFDEAWQGLLNLKQLGVVVMTNTVLTTLNAHCLTELVERVAPLQPERMEFWNYLPMEDYADERKLLVPMETLAPALRSALARAKAHDIRCAVKYVPQCLLGEFAECVDNTQPDVVIVEDFYDIYPKFACLWEAKCEHSETCLGLTHPYIAKFGYEAEKLIPVPRTRPWEEPEDGLAVGSDDPEARLAVPLKAQQMAGKPDGHHPAWEALVKGAAEELGGSLQTLLLDRRRCTYRFAVQPTSEESSTTSLVDVVLTKRSDDRPALLRSHSFNISYRNLRLANEGHKGRVGKVVQAIARVIAKRDDGALLLDERKGLVGPEAMRRPRTKAPQDA